MTRDRVAVDLVELGPWAPAPPDGWSPVAAICGEARDDLHELTERAVDAITTEITEYATLGAVPRRDLLESVYRNFDMLLLGIAEHRGPREEEIEVRRHLGRRRAMQGLPVQSLIGAFHVGYRELWATLVERAQHAGGDAPGLLLAGGSTVWGWIHVVTSAVADEYQREVARQRAAQARMRTRFFDLLTQDPDSDECRAVARILGFDPEGTFQAIALAAADGTQPAEAFEGLAAATAYDERRAATLIVCQGMPEAEIHVAVAGGAAGVGLEREGLHGARLSLIDAERALELAVQRGGVARFADVWLPAVVLSQRHTLSPLLAHGSKLAARNPHLADAVRTFAAAGFSAAAGARQLGISQTSFRYRLTRWQQLTGWDPWSFYGLSASLVACETSPER